MPTAEERLLEALTGSATLGQYPDTVDDRLMVALDASFEVLEARGKVNDVEVFAGTEPGPYRTPSTLLEDASQQVNARYRYDEASRWRNLVEAARQLEANMALIGAGIIYPGGGGGTTTPPPASSIVPAGAKLRGALDFDTGDLSQWSNLQTKDRNGSPGSYSTYSASVRDGGTGHPSAARFEVRNGDIPDFGGGERSEVRASSKYDVKAGQETWYSWSSRLGDAGGSFPGASGWGLIIMQWHSNSGSPPLSLHAQGGQISIRNDRSGGYTRNVCPIDAGNWHDYVLHVQWGSNGLIEMWRDGEKLTSFRATNTVGGESNYLKMGIYRSSENSGTHVVWHDGLRVYDHP